MPQGHTKTLVKVERKGKWGGDRNRHICTLINVQVKSCDSSVGIEERNAAICSSSISTKISRRGSEQAVQCAVVKLLGDERGREQKRRRRIQKKKRSQDPKCWLIIAMKNKWQNMIIQYTSLIQMLRIKTFLKLFYFKPIWVQLFPTIWIKVQ